MTVPNLTRRGFLGYMAAAVAALGVAAASVQVVPSAVEPVTSWGAGWSVGSGLKVGDVITIEGVYAVNPRTYRLTKPQRLQTMVVTAIHGETVTVDRRG